MTSSQNGSPLVTKWEAERALAIAEVEAYERQRALGEIRLLMRRYGLRHEDIGTVAGPEATCPTSVRSLPVEQN